LAVTAAYGSDAAHIASTSPALELVVKKATSTTTIASSANPANAGQTVTFTVTVTSSTTTPVGDVRLMDGNVILGIEVLTNGTATFSTATLAVGLHQITAIYEGTANIDKSTSSRLAQRVNLQMVASPGIRYV
jgi:large repetitive protein